MPVRVRSSGGRSGSWEVGHEGASGVPRRRMGFACAKSKVISVIYYIRFSLPYAPPSLKNAVGTRSRIVLARGSIRCEEVHFYVEDIS